MKGSVFCRMRSYNSALLFCLFTVAINVVFFLSSCSRDCDEIEKKTLYDKPFYFPFEGNEHLRYKVNNSDTSTFVGQGKTTFYVEEKGTEDECKVAYEGLQAEYKSVNSKIKISYYRDRERFNHIHDFDSYTFYRIEYKNNIYDGLLKGVSYKDSVLINGAYYKSLYFIGNDTNNCAVMVLGVGIVQIKSNGEVLNLIR